MAVESDERRFCEIMKSRMLILFLWVAFFTGWTGLAHGLSFRIATYNVENLFDMRLDRTDYPEYRPGNPQGWTPAMMAAKVENIAAVIDDLDAEIVALQEVESQTALMLLQEALCRRGVIYPHAAIAEESHTPVKCAVLSRFPFFSKKEISTGSAGDRDILKIGVDIAGHPLVLYVNHWKSKSGPESRRLAYARALAADISTLEPGTDFILTGDFNSDYNEYETFEDQDRLNDTRGITGINHVLGTLGQGRLVDEALLTSSEKDRLLYNLWLEVPEPRRWSVNFFGRKNSPDAILIPKSLYDGVGIAYVDNSFDKFDPDYLFDDQKVFRWQRTDNGKGRHTGHGYSDHLPVFAEFTTAPFQWKAPVAFTLAEPVEVRIADLYALKEGSVNVRLRNAVVIYKHLDSAVIKEKNGRAVFIYKVAGKLEPKTAYDLTVTELNRHYGNLEITGVRDIRRAGQAEELKAFYMTEPESDFAGPGFQNEVIAEIRGVYENGWFYYGDDRKIRIYFSEKRLTPGNFSTITLCYVRIGYHGHSEVIVEKPGQIR